MDINVPPILVYHKVDSNFEWGITRVKPKQFETHIRYLAENSYISLTLGEYDDLQETKELGHDKYVVITFDDTYQSVFSNAFPILKKYSFKATIFVVTDYIGQYNTWDVNLGRRKFLHATFEEIKEMLDYGIEIGSHSKTHPNLITLPSNQLYEELVESKRFIEDRLNKKVNYISYPFGNTNRLVVEATKKAGYRKGCVLHSMPPTYLKNDVINRQAVYLIDNLRSIQAKLGENRFHKLENYKLRLISSCSKATTIVKSIHKD